MQRVNIVSVQLVKEKTEMYDSAVIRCPEDVYNIASKRLSDKPKEYFEVICLNTKNKVAAISTVSIGTLNSSPVHPREIFTVACLANSAAIILVHNHPSGDPTPSKEDLDVTKRLSEAGKLIGIEVFDHLIVGDGRYVSLKEKGVL